MMDRTLKNFRIKSGVAVHYIKEWLRGDLNTGEYTRLMKRLNYFIGRLQNNKYVRMGKGTKIDLYIPAYPEPAFFRACDKFKVSKGHFPCTTVLISVTKACRFDCKHCYQKLDKGADVDLPLLIDAVRQLQDMGIAFFNIEGGDPFLKYDRLLNVCQAIDERSVIWINATGDGVTPERLKELKQNQVKAIMFSVHFIEPHALNDFMGRPYAWDTLISGISACKEAGMPFAFNACLGKEAFEDGSFENLMEFAKEKGASLVQLIKPKSAGAWLSETLPDTDGTFLDKVKAKVNMYNLDKRYEAYPSISAQIIEEDPRHFGCTAGGTDRFYINAKGDVQPCEFLNISYGNISERSFKDIYGEMRKDFCPPGTCWLCEANSKMIAKLYEKNGIETLPLLVELSKQVTGKWDRGEETELYRKMKEI